MLTVSKGNLWDACLVLLHSVGDRGSLVDCLKQGVDLLSLPFTTSMTTSSMVCLCLSLSVRLWTFLTFMTTSSMVCFPLTFGWQATPLCCLYTLAELESQKQQQKKQTKNKEINKNTHTQKQATPHLGRAWVVDQAVLAGEVVPCSVCHVPGLRVSLLHAGDR